MLEYYLNIRILKKDKDVTFKVKRFPVLIGKGRAKNIIPVEGDGVELKHGIFFKKGNRIFYEDTSRNGTRVNGRLILRDKIPLIKGTNEIQIGRYRIIVQSSSTGIGGKNNKFWFYLLIPIMIILLTTLSFFAYSLFFEVKTIKLTDFSLEPVPLNPYNEIKLKQIHFEESVDPNAEITYNLYFTNPSRSNTNATDTIRRIQKYGNSTPIEFRLPERMINENTNENLITVGLELFSDRYRFIPLLKKQYMVSKREKIETKNGITLKTKILGMVFDYELLSNNKPIKSIQVNYGDNSSIKNRNKDVYLYEKKGKYKFTVAVKLNGRKIKFKRLVIVD